MVFYTERDSKIGNAARKYSKFEPALLATKRPNLNKWGDAGELKGSSRRRRKPIFEACSVYRQLFFSFCTLGLPWSGYSENFSGLVEIENILLLEQKNAIVLAGLEKREPTAQFSWVGLMGVNWQPNHYPTNIPTVNPFNYHDVFYVGQRVIGGNTTPVTNCYAEMEQLQAAGFTAVRSYQTTAYSWIDIIQQANKLGMHVVYEANIPQNPIQSQIDTAIATLNSVITAVTPTIFQNTVVLILAGHENYSSTDVGILASAIGQLQNAVPSVPVSVALVSGDLVSASGQVGTDMVTLLNRISLNAPIGFDPYPFQWGATPSDQAVTNASVLNSIAYDYGQIPQWNLPINGRTIIMAETGWSTGPLSGSPCYPAGYACSPDPSTLTCSSGGACQPGAVYAAQYLTALYGYVSNLSNHCGAFVFEAYDEPAKDSSHPNDVENFYGVFDTNGYLKGQGFTPRTFDTTKYRGCQGFTSGALFIVVGTAPAGPHQPPFTVQVSQTNPTTNQDASFTVTVPTMDRTDISVYPWPEYLIFNGATASITGSSSNTSTATASVSSSGVITWTVTQTQPYVSWTDNITYLPANY